MIIGAEVIDKLIISSRNADSMDSLDSPLLSVPVGHHSW